MKPSIASMHSRAANIFLLILSTAYLFGTNMIVVMAKRAFPVESQQILPPNQLFMWAPKWPHGGVVDGL
jgi:hypothetical protein